MNHASTFTGLGGFDLAAEWMGWNNVFNCEINPFCRKILNYYWPNTISYEDATKTDFKSHRGTIDVLSGGFPCQPVSSAGNRKGKDDDRWHWPTMLRTIRETQTRYFVGENVPGILTIEHGLVFEQICIDLENEGYKVWPYLIPACSKNAPHKRERVWIIAYRDSNEFSGNKKPTKNYDRRNEKGLEKGHEFNALFSSGIITNTNGSGLEGIEEKKERKFTDNGNYWREFPIEPPIYSGNDGFSSQLDGITFSKWRQESIKGYGNAVVPQIAYEIFKAIQEYDTNTIATKKTGRAD